MGEILAILGGGAVAMGFALAVRLAWSSRAPAAEPGAAPPTVGRPCRFGRHREDLIDSYSNDKAIVAILRCTRCGQLSRVISSPYLAFGHSRKVIPQWPEAREPWTGPTTIDVSR